MQPDPQRLDVIPKRGFGPAQFGMSVREVEAVLGQAMEAGFYDDGGERTITLIYPGASMFFDQSDDFRLSIIEVDQECSCGIFGERLFPRSHEQVLALLHRNFSDEDLGPVQEKRDEDLEELSLNLPSQWMTFYFNLSGDLQGVNWSVSVNPDDQVDWPHTLAMSS